MFLGAPLELGHGYALPPHDSVGIETLRFYVSQIQLVQGTQIVALARPQHRLVDAEEPGSQELAIAVPQGFAADKLVFLLGVDSLTQAAGAMGEDLDPTQGMYWAWQSGYIHFKLEGKSPICPARNHAFQFHLGGFTAPFETLQRVEIPLNPGQQSIVIAFPVDQLLGRVALRETYQVMRPCAEAVELARAAAGLFTLGK